MAEIVRMPRMSDTMEEGVIVSWLKKEGEEVKRGDVLAEIETDKATMDFESLWNGNLLYIGAKVGEAVEIDGIIAIIGEKGEDYKALLESAKVNGTPTEQEPAVQSSGKSTQTILGTPEEEHAEVGSQVHIEATSTETAGRIKASPLAKAMAAEAGISLGDIQGTGDQGRIVKKDVELFVKSGISTSQTDSSSISSFSIKEEYEEVRVSQMRKTIAKRLSESKFTAPHFYLTIEINMGRAVEARKKILKMTNQKISFNDMVVKAAALALRKHPSVNASWMGATIRRNKHIHIGVAVAVADGLLVPVIRNADFKPMMEINQEVKTLAVKAKEKKLQPEEMQGNTFTISNLGMFGIEEFTAIINPPDSCILAVGSIIEKPVVEDGEIKIGKMMKVTLSCDHRVVDGVTGAQFLQTFKQSLEEPLVMLV